MFTARKRPLFNQFKKFSGAQKKTIPFTPSLLTSVQRANFGGMMGMGQLADDLAAKCPPNDQIELWGMDDRSSLLVTYNDKPGALNQATKILANNNINVTAINSAPPKTMDFDEKVCTVTLDFNGALEDPNVQRALDQLQREFKDVSPVGSREVPWFPTKIEDFDFIGKRILSEGDGIQDANHPGFRDPVYRARRELITNFAMDYKIGEEIPRLNYTDVENGVWKFCYDKLTKLFPTHACDEFNWSVDQFKKEIGMNGDEIP